jgi:hypothetical protein
MERERLVQLLSNRLGFAVMVNEKLVSEAGVVLDPEEREHLPLEATAKERKVMTEKTFCVL